MIPRGLILEALDDKTSADYKGWTKDNPLWGQCAVVALLVQDLFGGELLRSTVNGTSHYWNRLPGGTQLDFTIEQFGPTAAYDKSPIVRDRKYVLAFPATKARYQLLRHRIGKSWA